MCNNRLAGIIIGRVGPILLFFFLVFNNITTRYVIFNLSNLRTGYAFGYLILLGNYGLLPTGHLPDK